MKFTVKGKTVHRSTGQRIKYKAMKVEKQEKERLNDMGSAKVKKSIGNLRDPNMLFSEAIERAYEERWKDKRYGKQVKNKLLLMLDELGRDIKVADIGPAHIVEIRQKLKELKNSETTIKRALTNLKTLLKMSQLEWQVTDRIPYIRFEKEKNKRTRVISHREESKLLRTLRDEMGKDPRSYGPHLADLTEVLLETGMRLGEALQLRFKDHIDIDYNQDYGVINLFPEMVKSNEPRTIPLTKRAQEVLIRRSKKFRGRLFPYRNTTMCHTFEKARKRMGLEKDKQFVIHSLRHTLASRLVQKGVDLYVVRDLLGHSSITVTERYAHLNVDRLWKGIQTLEEEKGEDTDNEK